MQDYKIIGFTEHRFYKSKSTGRDVGCQTLYLSFSQPKTLGIACQSIFASDSVLNGYLPKVGDTVNLYYRPDFQGRAILDSIVKK